jgi:branched-chain amino acid transport system permease protein
MSKLAGMLRSPTRVISAASLVALALVPVYAAMFDAPYYVTLFSRIVIFALAALSLAPILSYGGMVSFGHALYLGVGAYSVGLLAHHGVVNGWIHLAATLAVSALISAVTGMICLRTTGLGFLMITFAFGQMFYFLMVSLKYYGGDEGLPINARSDFSPLLNLGSNVVLYYVAFGLLLGALYLLHRLVNSHFGMIIRGCKSNERRVNALGISSFRYKLTAYVLSAMICGVAGMLLANLTRFASPEYMSWIRSGDLIVMVVLGGMNSLMGGVIGAVVLMALEEILSSWTQHWMVILGPLIVIMVLVAKEGLYGALVGGEARRNLGTAS